MLICDEPTSGLDSFMAQNVLQVLKRLALKGKTIILTIHQPSSNLYNLFDKLLLVAEGRVAFLGTPKDAAAFFNSMEMVCPSNYNPADFYVEMLAVSPDNIIENRKTVEGICDAYESSNFAKNVQSSINLNKSNANLWSAEKTPQDETALWFTQFRIVLWRSWKTVHKDPQLIKSRLIQTVVRILCKYSN